MKKTLTLLVLAAMGASALLAGCDRGTTRRSDRSEATGEMQTAGIAEEYAPVAGTFGGRMVQATISEPKSFNPITSSETSTSDYTNLMFLGLTKVDPWTYEPQAELATRWEPDESGLVWTVHLRDDVTWSDGAPFSADDVLFTYDTIYNPDIPCSTRDIISGPNGERWAVEKVDAHTVRFTLYERNAIFPLLLATGIVPKHRFEPMVQAGTFASALGSNATARDFAVTGPFIVDRYDTGTGRVFMKRNPRYYRTDAAGQRLPYLDEILFVIVKDSSAAMLKFRQGETDIHGIQGSDYPDMKPLERSGNFTIYGLGPAGGSEFLFFNQNTGRGEDGKPYVVPHKLAWFRDTRFRQAVSYAIDRQFIVASIMNNLGYPQYGPMNHANEHLYFANPNMPRYEFDLDKARALLAEMGLKDRNGDGKLEDAAGNRVSFTLTTNTGNDVRMRVAETIRSDLERLGMEINFRPMQFNTLISKLDATYDWEACVMGLTGGPEPHWGANIWRSDTRMHMWFPYQKEPSTEWEAEINRLFAEGVAELDRQKRREIYFRWQQIVGEQQPFIYTAAPERLTAIRNTLGNVFPAPFGTLHNIDEVFLKGASGPAPASAPAGNAAGR